MNLFSGLEKFGIKATDSTDLYADEKAAEKKTKEKIVKALKNMNLSIEQIAQAVELTKKEVEAILKTQEN